MRWVTWDQAAVGAVVFLVAYLVLRRARRPNRLVTFAVALTAELTLISTLYSIWRIAHRLPFTHESGAMDRARWLLDVQEWMHLPSEIGLQHFVIHHHLAWITNAYYATMHVPSLIAFMIWLFVRHRDHYPHWRNGLALLTLGCLIIRFIRVAPPRFLPELHFVDLSIANGFDVYGPVGTGVSDQFAAMPSIHVGWAAVVALGAVAASRSPWRWVVFMHLPITLFVVAATGHHWWLDGLVAIALLWAGLWLDRQVRNRWTRRASRAHSENRGRDGLRPDTVTSPS